MLDLRLDLRTPTGRWRHGLFWQTCQNMSKHPVVL